MKILNQKILGNLSVIVTAILLLMILSGGYFLIKSRQNIRFRDKYAVRLTPKISEEIKKFRALQSGSICEQLPQLFSGLKWLDIH